MNRTGGVQDELGFKTIELIIAGLILLIVIAVSYKLYSVYQSGEAGLRAEDNLNILDMRIKQAQDQSRGIESTATILQLPPRHALIGFSRTQNEMEFGGEDNPLLRFFALGSHDARPLVLTKPNECDEEACICAYELQDRAKITETNTDERGVLTLELLTCKKYAVNRISGTFDQRFGEEGTQLRFEVRTFSVFKQSTLLLLFSGAAMPLLPVAGTYVGNTFQDRDLILHVPAFEHRPVFFLDGSKGAVVVRFHATDDDLVFSTS